MFDRQDTLPEVREAHDIAPTILPEITVAEDSTKRALPASEGFQLPRKLWAAMFACYATFISSLAIATGGSGHARMALAIAALFMLVYFSTASILARIGKPDRYTVDHARPLQTIYGPMAARDVWVQVLSIPLALVLFGVSMVAVVASVGP